jgi:hypothetical protein
MIQRNSTMAGCRLAHADTNVFRRETNSPEVGQRGRSKIRVARRSLRSASLRSGSKEDRHGEMQVDFPVHASTSTTRARRYPKTKNLDASF